MAAARAARKRREKYETRAKIRREQDELAEAEIHQWFDKFDDDDSKYLDAGELLNLFKFIEPGCEVDVQFIKKQLPSEECSKDDIIRVVKQYRYYAKQQKYLDDLFAKYDVDSDGKLTEEELFELMKDKARGVTGHTKQVKVTKEDVSWVMEICKSEEAGGIPRENLLAAIGQWHVLAEKKRDRESMKESSKFCEIL